MILSNVEIQKAIKAGRLIIEPVPKPLKPEVGKDCPYDTHTVDLTLGPQISIPIAAPFNYDLTLPGLAEFISRNSKQHALASSSPYQLKTGEFILGITQETIGLPIKKGRGPCLAARIEGKSSRARCGLLIHFTAPTVHPGWFGPLALEMINLGKTPILLIPGMAIAQLIVEEVKGIPFDKNSQFQKQVTPAGSTSK